MNVKSCILNDDIIIETLLNEIVYSLIQAWSGIMYWARDPAEQLTEPWIELLLVDLSFSLVLENRIISSHYCREHAHH